jgi:hypothetical protein
MICNCGDLPSFRSNLSISDSSQWSETLVQNFRSCGMQNVVRDFDVRQFPSLRGFIMNADEVLSGRQYEKRVLSVRWVRGLHARQMESEAGAVSFLRRLALWGWHCVGRL